MGLKLTHPPSNEGVFETDILIGVDHNWNIVEDEIIRGYQPTVAKSKTGRVTSTHQSTLVKTSIPHVMTAKKINSNLSVSGICNQ